MKKKYIFNIIGIVLVIILIISVNYITSCLLDNLESQRIKKVTKISVKDNEEVTFSPHNIEESIISDVLRRENSFFPVNDSNKRLLSMSEAINIALNDLKLFKESGIIPNEIDLDKINQTYATLLVSAPYSVIEEKTQEELKNSSAIIIPKRDESAETYAFDELDEEYYFWNITFVGEDMEIYVFINNYTGNIWDLTVFTYFDKVSAIKSKEEISKLYSQYLEIYFDTEPILQEDGYVVTRYNDFNLSVYTNINEDSQDIYITLFIK